MKEGSVLKILLKIIAIFLPLLLSAACSDNSSPESSGYESPPAPPISDKLSVSAQQSSSETAEGLSPATGTGTQVSIVNGDPGGKTGKYLFTPNTLSFKKGESVDFTLTTESEVHNFNVEELKLDTDINAGETLSFNYVFDKVGTYKYICIFHEANGMVGTISVSE